MIALEEGGVIAGRYRLERELARGGMGAVWIAQHLQLDVAVAVKFMEPTFAASAEARARFEREAKAAAKLQSPHVVQVHDYGVENGMPFIAMELLQGDDLGARLKEQGKLSLKETAVIIAQVAKALRRAHDAGIVHRDLKPGNIFIARHQEEEIVKVLDFGIAKATDASKVGESTKTGTLMGSPHYMSPEQARGSKQLDYRSDIWSLGVIVFKMITGQLPFPGEEIGEVIMAICADPIPTPSQVAPHLGPDVDRFFERALARDVTKRFQSARELAEAFTAVAEVVEGAKSGWAVAPPAMGDGEITGPPRPRAAELPTPQPAAAGSISIRQGDGDAASDDAKTVLRDEPASSAIAPAAAPAAPASAAPASAAAASAAPASAAPASSSAAAINGTLAPTGNSLAQPPSRTSRSTLLAALGVGFVVVVGAFLLFRSSSPSASGIAAATNAPTANAPTAPAAAPTATAVATATATAAPADTAAPESSKAAASSAPDADAGASPSVAKGKLPAKAIAPAGKPKSSVLGF